MIEYRPKNLRITYLIKMYNISSEKSWTFEIKKGLLHAVFNIWNLQKKIAKIYSTIATKKRNFLNKFWTISFPNLLINSWEILQLIISTTKCELNNFFCGTDSLIFDIDRHNICTHHPSLMQSCWKFTKSSHSSRLLVKFTMSPRSSRCAKTMD